jgi:hypothetical protein
VGGDDSVSDRDVTTIPGWDREVIGAALTKSMPPSTHDLSPVHTNSYRCSS